MNEPLGGLRVRGPSALRGRRSFTIVELLAAVFLYGAMSIVLAQGLGRARGTVLDAGERARAAIALESEMEEVLATTSFGASGAPGPAPVSYPVSRGDIAPENVWKAARTLSDRGTPDVPDDDIVGVVGIWVVPGDDPGIPGVASASYERITLVVVWRSGQVDADRSLKLETDRYAAP